MDFKKSKIEIIQKGSVIGAAILENGAEVDFGTLTLLRLTSTNFQDREL